MLFSEAPLADAIGCKVGKFPSKYLGLPLSLENLQRSLWDPVVERIDRKMGSWKGKLRSLRGKTYFNQVNAFKYSNISFIMFQVPFQCFFFLSVSALSVLPEEL